MRRIGTVTVALATVGAVTAACSSGSSNDPITLLAHDSFAEFVTEETFARFTTDTGIAVEVLAAGDAGAMVNQAVLARGRPLADVLFGIDDTYLSRALDAGIFDTYESPLIGDVLSELVDGGDRVTPIDYGDVCINYDRSWFAATQTDVPSDLDSLRSPPYAGQLAVEHPATSSPGLAFMLATIAHFGEDGWHDFWADLRDGGVRVVADWTSAYYSQFSTHGGPSSMVVSYASSPPAEVIFSETPTEEPPTGVIDAGCYRQVEYAGVLAGTDQPDAARELIDFMLSIEFQEAIPLTWFVFPANRHARLPQPFVDHVTIPESPLRLPAAYVAENRDRWIDEWIQVMER